MSKDLDEYTAQHMTDQMVDILQPSEVEIRIRFDGGVVWVNVNDVCKFRAKVSDLTLIDERPCLERNPEGEVSIPGDFSEMAELMIKGNLHKEGE